MAEPTYVDFKHRLPELFCAMARNLTETCRAGCGDLAIERESGGIRLSDAAARAIADLVMIDQRNPCSGKRA